MTLTSCKFKELIRTDSECYKAGETINPIGIVIHGTAANNPLLGRWVKTDNPKEIAVNPNNNWFGGKYNEVTPHATIGILDGSNVKGDEIALCQILPYNRRSWTVGSGKLGSFNASHIQIEMCQDVSRGKEYLENVLCCTAEWCAELMLMYPAISIDTIVSHKEAAALGYGSNHGDPENWLNPFGITMNDFRQMVKIWYDKKTAPEKEETYYRVQVGAFLSRASAEQYAQLLRDKYSLECFVSEGKK